MTTVPSFLTGRKMKILYLLALFQLVAGPIVIFQVSLLGRMTAGDVSVPEYARASGEAIQSSEFRTFPEKQISTAGEPSFPGKKAPASPQSPDTKGKASDGKTPALPWKCIAAPPTPRPELAAIAERIRVRLPVWPQAPPSPPPRVG